MSTDPIFAVEYKMALVWLSYLLFPVAAILTRQVMIGTRFKILSALILIPTTLLIYARFIEPQRLTVKEHKIEVCGGGLPGNLRAAVASDFHIGIFPNAPSMNRVVYRIHQQQPDLLLIPGDFTYHLKADEFDKVFEPLGALGIPVYAVMGNHDVGLPGEAVGEELTRALERHNVTVLNPGEATFSKDGKFLRIVGFRDLWESEQRPEGLGPIPKRDRMPTIYLQHNPDMIKEAALGSFDLMVAGHTHGGQVLLPGITCAMTLACDTLRYGYEDTPVGKLFVTSGTGMVGLPIRFGVPPRIDILNIELDRCREEPWERINKISPHDQGKS